MSLAAYHASHFPTNGSLQLHVSSLIPLFQDEVHLAAMQCHAIDVVSQAVRFLNPGQVPSIVCGQPLYAITKKIQWN